MSYPAPVAPFGFYLPAPKPLCNLFVCATLRVSRLFAKPYIEDLLSLVFQRLWGEGGTLPETKLRLALLWFPS